MLENLKNTVTSMLPFSKKTQLPLRLVVALNQVDKITPNGWNPNLNLPKPEAKEQIERRCDDAIKKLIKETGITQGNLEYYSALKRYRLMYLLNKIIQNAYGGFKLENINPKDPFDLADPDAKKYAEKERPNLNSNSQQEFESGNQILNEFQQIISPDELKSLISKIQQEAELPPRVAVIGKAGVGKTTTINNLFNADLTTSPTTVGTTQAQTKKFTLSTGGTLTVIDLPGYGRSEKEDQEYEKIYQDLIPSCDLILLVLQADDKGFSDDIEMIKKIKNWIQNSPIPQK
ncbi:50S ribosome-binding GTPase [Laspinema sp. D1]|uniref:GTPase n=1 Tax=Laspinema palackyanum TaxID=3231601 RepID=UPI00347D5502|nr:50S ribosome-binding GTPase [Laspinema sp. D2b]